MLILCREERQNFIRLKYIDRQFSIPEETPDKEILDVMKNRPPGEDEEELFNDSAEVGSISPDSTAEKLSFK